MSNSNLILLTPSRRGRFMESKIKTAEKPGTVVQIDVSEGLSVNGWPAQWEVYAPGTDGHYPGLMGILLPALSGSLATEAYVAGDECQVYIPVNGDEFKLIVGDASSAFGDIMIPDSGTGKLVADAGTPHFKPFQMLKATTGADELGHCIFCGS